MTDYIGITEAQSNPFAPLTSELVKQLRDNPIAIAEGDDPAPRIAGVAIGTFIGRGSFGDTGVAITDLDPRGRLIAIVGGEPDSLPGFRLSNDNGVTWGEKVNSLGLVFINLSNGNSTSTPTQFSGGLGSTSGNNFNAIEFSLNFGSGFFEVSYLNRGA